MPLEGGRKDDVQTNSFKFVYGNARGGRACLSAVDSRARSIRRASGSDQKCIRSADLWSLCENEKCRTAPHLHGDQPGARPLLSEQSPFRKICRARHWRRLSERAFRAGGRRDRKACNGGPVADGAARAAACWSMARQAAG